MPERERDEEKSESRDERCSTAATIGRVLLGERRKQGRRHSSADRFASTQNVDESTSNTHRSRDKEEAETTNDYRLSQRIKEKVNREEREKKGG